MYALSNNMLYENTQVDIICKNCSSNLVVKHGHNFTARGKVQRYFCKNCNHNFN